MTFNFDQTPTPDDQLTDITRSQIELLEIVGAIQESFQSLFQSLMLVLTSANYKEEFFQREVEAAKEHFKDAKNRLEKLEDLNKISAFTTQDTNQKISTILSSIESLTNTITQHLINNNNLRTIEQFRAIMEDVNRTVKSDYAALAVKLGGFDKLAEISAKQEEIAESVSNFEALFQKWAPGVPEINSAKILQLETDLTETKDKIKKVLEYHYSDNYLDNEGKDLSLQAAVKKWFFKNLSDALSKGCFTLLLLLIFGAWLLINTLAKHPSTIK